MVGAAGEGAEVRVGREEVIARVPLNTRNPASLPENESKTLTRQSQNSDQSYSLVFPKFEYEETFLWTNIPEIGPYLMAVLYYQLIETLHHNKKLLGINNSLKKKLYFINTGKSTYILKKNTIYMCLSVRGPEKKGMLLHS